MSRTKERIAKQLDAISEGFLRHVNDERQPPKKQMSAEAREENDAKVRAEIIDLGATIIAGLLDIREELGRIADCLEEQNK